MGCRARIFFQPMHQCRKTERQPASRQGAAQTPPQSINQLHSPPTRRWPARGGERNKPSSVCLCAIESDETGSEGAPQVLAAPPHLKPTPNTEPKQKNRNQKNRNTPPQPTLQPTPQPNHLPATPTLDEAVEVIESTVVHIMDLI